MTWFQVKLVNRFCRSVISNSRMLSKTKRMWSKFRSHATASGWQSSPSCSIKSATWRFFSRHLRYLRIIPRLSLFWLAAMCNTLPNKLSSIACGPHWQIFSVNNWIFPGISIPQIKRAGSISNCCWLCSGKELISGKISLKFEFSTQYKIIESSSRSLSLLRSLNLVSSEVR